MKQKKFRNDKDDLREALVRFVYDVIGNEELYSSVGEVLSVDTEEKTCSINIIDGAVIEDVRLNQVSNSEGLLIYPKIGSIVVISWTDNYTAYLSMYSEIEEIIFQDGENEGLVKVVELTDKINTLENTLNSLISKYNAHIHITTATVGSTTVPGVIAPITNTETGTIAPITNKNEIQNPKFKH